MALVTVPNLVGTDLLGRVFGAGWGWIELGLRADTDVVGRTGWDERVKITLGNGQRFGNYQVGPATESVQSGMSNAVVSGQTPDDSLPTGGSTSGN